MSDVDVDQHPIYSTTPGPRPNRRSGIIVGLPSLLLLLLEFLVDVEYNSLYMDPYGSTYRT